MIICDKTDKRAFRCPYLLKPFKSHRLGYLRFRKRSRLAAFCGEGKVLPLLGNRVEGLDLRESIKAEDGPAKA
jgi:hypothetical protein